MPMTAKTDEIFAWRPIVICWLLVLALFYLPQVLGGAAQPAVHRQ